MVEQVLLDRSTMVLPLDEVSKYFISEKNRKKSKRFEVSFVSDPTLIKRVWPAHRRSFCHQPSSFPSWQSRSALAPRLASPIRAPQVPYSRVLGPTTPATRRNHQQTRNNAASIDMAIVMRIIGKLDRKLLVAFHPSIMATERSKGAPGGRFVRPKPLP